MDAFESNFKALDDAGRRMKLANIVMFLRQQNSNEQADAFQELAACYPTFLPFPQPERELRELIAWNKVSKFLGHPTVAHILRQG